MYKHVMRKLRNFNPSDSVANSPEGTVGTKCFKSLQLLKKSLQITESKNKVLSTYPGFNVQLNLEALLTLHVENLHAITHSRETHSVYTSMP